MRKVIICVMLGCLLIIIAGCGSSSPVVKSREPEPTKALTDWQVHHKGFKTVLWREADVNGDKLKDTILIYKKKNKCFLTVIFGSSQGFITLKPVPAPAENQHIQFKDIDEKTPLEFIVSGNKGANYGYAIFRIVKNRIIDLFGQDMDKCC